MIASNDPAEAGVSPLTSTALRLRGKLQKRVYVGMLMLAGLVVAGTIAALLSRSFPE
jgi:hypothetical protein